MHSLALLPLPFKKEARDGHVSPFIGEPLQCLLFQPARTTADANLLKSVLQAGFLQTGEDTGTLWLRKANTSPSSPVLVVPRGIPASSAPRGGSLTTAAVIQCFTFPPHKHKAWQKSSHVPTPCNFAVPRAERQGWEKCLDATGHGATGTRFNDTLEQC